MARRTSRTSRAGYVPPPPRRKRGQKLTLHDAKYAAQRLSDLLSSAECQCGDQNEDDEWVTDSDVECDACEAESRLSVITRYLNGK